MQPQQYLAQITQIFKSFDLDNSGSIELAELKKVAQALGQNLSEVQLRQIVKKLDTNKDGKISLKEFQFWWLYGVKGKLGQLVYLRAKTLKLTHGFLKKFQKAGVDLTNLNKNSKVDKLDLDFSFGEPIKDGLKLDAIICHKGYKFTQHFNQLTKLIPSLKQDEFNMCFFMSTDNPTKLKDDLYTIFNRAKDELVVKIQSLENNTYASLKFITLKDAVAMHIEFRENLKAIFDDSFQQFDEIDQEFNKQMYLFGQASVQTNFSIAQLLDEANLIQTLLKGLSLNMKVEVPSSITKMFREALEAQKQPAPDFAFLLLLLLKTLKFKLRLNTPAKIQNFFKKLGISQLITECPSFKNVLQIASLILEAQQSKASAQNPLNYLYLLLKILKNQLGQSFEVCIQRKQTLLKVRKQLPGGSKLFQMIYNEL